MRTREELKEMLSCIDPATLSYSDWIAVGMALKEEGGSAADWEDWSARDGKRYHAGECARKWETFRGETETKVTGGTLFELACRSGWTPGGPGTALEWDSIIGDGPEQGVVVDVNWVEGQDVAEPKAWDPVCQITTYLKTLFDSTENVGYVTESYRDRETGRFMPAKGSCSRTAGELIEALDQCGGDIGKVLGDYNPECGAWIRFNPLDGQGVRNANVTDYRYALVESDSMDIPKQHEIIRRLELPVAVLVHSGRKSLHAIVRIDAKDYDEYRRRVDYLYGICEKNGLAIDKQNRNPSRLSRMPGIMRNGKKQFIVATNFGQKDFLAWQEWIEAVNDNLPDPESMADAWDNLPALAPPLIEGVLRQGHKMLLAGPSKAGKSFALIELAIAIAEGQRWFSWPCVKGKVLYVNLELDRASCLHRFRDVYEAKGLAPKNLRNIEIWNLRGKSAPMDKLAPKLIRRAKSKNYIAVILDPIYKVITGDENSADQMAQFCNQFDKVCTELSCAVIYCHHHSKGDQGGKKSMDRASGSGVFARDPDALIDIMELELNEDIVKQEENKAVCRKAAAYLDRRLEDWRDDVGQDDVLTARALLEYMAGKLPEDDYLAFTRETLPIVKERARRRTAWRIEGTLREFPRFDPLNLWFDYPVHLADDSGVLGDIRQGAPQGRPKNLGRRKNGNERQKDRRKGLESAYEIIKSFDENKPVTLKQMAEYTGATERTVRNHIREHDGFVITNHGEVIKKE